MHARWSDLVPRILWVVSSTTTKSYKTNSFFNAQLLLLLREVLNMPQGMDFWRSFNFASRESRSEICCESRELKRRRKVIRLIASIGVQTGGGAPPPPSLKDLQQPPPPVLQKFDTTSLFKKHHKGFSL